ncbi:hypothetical protein BYT27DRAFT_7287627 [Phlegmacium glaucopus]|nr:hypothetical protein BYT27DRAFT_7287627 [Phlegmacium glaucopus]
MRVRTVKDREIREWLCEVNDHCPGNLSWDNSSLGSTTSLLLSVNYIPSKFSNDEPNLPKRGGGLQAFKTNEPRMPQGKGRLRWHRFKWILFVTNFLLMFFSIDALVVCLLSWFNIFQNANVIHRGNRSELILPMIAACSAHGTPSITFAFLVTPGYVTYKCRTFNLEGKINAQWSCSLDTSEQLRIQNELECCGYFSPLVEASISQTCYARSILPGCKGPYLVFERKLLALWIKAVFSLVLVQILVMVAGLLCSNHITYRFGKGMMPEAYQLDMNMMAVIIDNYANQLSDQYGADIASNILRRTWSKSVLGNNTINACTLLDSPEHDIAMDPFKPEHMGTPSTF